MKKFVCMALMALATTGVAAKGGNKALHIDLAILDVAMLQAVERNGTIHGARVDVGVACILGQGLGHCALAARRGAVDGHIDEFLFHDLKKNIYVFPSAKLVQAE